MKRHISLFIITLGLMVMTACSSNKSNVKTDYQNTDTTVPQAATSSVSTKTVYEQLVAGYKDWTDVQMPVKLALSSPKSFSFSGRMSMVKGKDILLSFRVLGMEVANVYVDADSIYAVDKYHKYFCSESLANVFKKASITDVQNLLMGRAVIFGEGILTSKMYSKVNVQAEESSWRVSPKTQLSNFDYSYLVDDNNGEASVSQLEATITGQTPATCTYSSPTETDAGLVAKSATINATMGKQNIIASLEWTLRSAKWNEGKTNTWSRPSGYQRIEAKNILKIFNSL